VAFSPDGSVIASGGGDGAIKIWRTSDGKQTLLLTGHSKAVTGLVFSPDGKTLYSGSSDYTIRLWQTSDGRYQRALPGPAAAVTGISISKDGSLLAASFNDTTARIWNIAEGKLIQTISNAGKPVFSPDGSLIASAGSNLTMRIWQVSDGKILLTYPKYSPIAIQFIDDGRRMITGSSDGQTSIWGIKEGSNPLATLEPIKTPTYYPCMLKVYVSVMTTDVTGKTQYIYNGGVYKLTVQSPQGNFTFSSDFGENRSRVFSNVPNGIMTLTYDHPQFKAEPIVEDYTNYCASWVSMSMVATLK
jgi:WD40 repeat protein